MRMHNSGKSWLQLYVDAMMEKDPFKRLNLVRELSHLPKQADPEERPAERVAQPRREAKRAARHRRPVSRR